jgi:hypothetical protein
MPTPNEYISWMHDDTASLLKSGRGLLDKLTSAEGKFAGMTDRGIRNLGLE